MSATNESAQKPNGGAYKPNGGEHKPNGNAYQPNGGAHKPNGSIHKPSELWEIQTSCQQIAEAVSAALGVETEIIDSYLRIIAATGLYQEDIGQIEEGGKIENGYLFGRVIATGREFVVANPREDPTYDPASLTGDIPETGLICCPISLDEEIVGVMALFAMTPEQRQVIFEDLATHMEFLRRMTFLLAGKVAERRAVKALELTTVQLSTTLEALRDGVITFDENKLVTQVNRQAATLLGRSNLLGQPVARILKDEAVRQALESNNRFLDQEVFIQSRGIGGDKHVYVSVLPIKVDGSPAGGVIVLKDARELQGLAYSVTEQKENRSFDEIIGSSKAIRDLKDRAMRISFGNSTVLVTGESGTGKDLLARAIHSASPRCDGPFVAVNCSAIPESLLESELFGYAPGAFTGADRKGKPGKIELADKGTLLLDEIGDMPLHLQAKLLRVLQDHTIIRLGSNRERVVDIRVIATTNRDIEKMMREKEFREDLYFRLSVIPLRIPPLRERREDILPLLRHCLDRYTRITRKTVNGFAEEVLDLFLSYDWPGNVRELQNAIEYGINMEEGQIISMSSVPPRIVRWGAVKDEVFSMPLREIAASSEEEAVRQAMAEAGPGNGQVERAAKLLGISRATMYRKLAGLRGASQAICENNSRSR